MPQDWEYLVNLIVYLASNEDQVAATWLLKAKLHRVAPHSYQRLAGLVVLQPGSLLLHLLAVLVAVGLDSLLAFADVHTH